MTWRWPENATRAAETEDAELEDGTLHQRPGSPRFLFVITIRAPGFTFLISFRNVRVGGGIRATKIPVRKVPDVREPFVEPVEGIDELRVD